MSNYQLPVLPNLGDIESTAVYKQLARSHRALAELKGVSQSMPNQDILISTLSLQEAKESSAIENIITTQDDLFRHDFGMKKFTSHAVKEVYSYADALKLGFNQVQKSGLLINQDIKKIQEVIVRNEAGFRTQIGTALKDQNGQIIYTPPHPDKLGVHMNNLVEFINDNEGCDYDVLTKMAIIHHQFESIHPFYDGNGRTGRVINILYLVLEELLDTPILYLSRYINRNKSDYYQYLQDTRDTGEWETWLLFILLGVEETAQQNTKLIQEIKKLMLDFKEKLRSNLPKIYSQDLINNLFKYPYTKIDFIHEDLQVSRQTASRHLEKIVDLGLLDKIKRGKDNFYLNKELFDLLSST